MVLVSGLSCYETSSLFVRYSAVNEDNPRVLEPPSGIAVSMGEISYALKQ
jgi:hypothetical protein